MLSFAVLGLALVLGSWLHYLWLIPQERVPKEPRLHSIAMFAGMIFAVIGIIDAWWWLGLALALGLTLPAGGFFLWLLTQARLPHGQLAVNEGEQLPAFSAATDTGATWSTDELAGKRALVKFFRGHW